MWGSITLHGFANVSQNHSSLVQNLSRSARPAVARSNFWSILAGAGQRTVWMDFRNILYSQSAMAISEPFYAINRVSSTMWPLAGSMPFGELKL